MNPLTLWLKFNNYGDWCYQYRIPTIDEFVDRFEYQLCSSCIGRYDPYGEIKYFDEVWSNCEVGTAFDFKKEIIEESLKTGDIRVLKNNTKIYMKVDEDDCTIKEGVYYNTYVQYRAYKLSGHKVSIMVNPKIKQEEQKKQTNNIKSKYKLGLKLIKPRLNILSKLVKITLNNIINTIPERWLGLEKGYQPLHDPEEIKNNLYNHQPEKNPQFINRKKKGKVVSEERLVYIATKDRKQYARVKWHEANEKMITQLADEPQWEYISKKEGKKYFNTISLGQSFIPASEPWIEKKKDYETGEEYEEYVGTFKNIYKPSEFIKTKSKSSTKRVDKSNHIKPKRSHPGRNSNLKSVLWNVTLTKYNKSSVGPIEGCNFEVNAVNEQSAINKAWNKFVPLYDIKLTEIKPYYNAVAKRLEESNTSISNQDDRSTKSFLEPKKHVLITTLKNGEKKITEITSYKRVYVKPEPSPFKKNWKCPTSEFRIKPVKEVKPSKRHCINPEEKYQKYLEHKQAKCSTLDLSKKFFDIKVKEERKKLNKELKLKKQNKVVERKIVNKKILV
jgi:hypothetical protein